MSENAALNSNFKVTVASIASFFWLEKKISALQLYFLLGSYEAHFFPSKLMSITFLVYQYNIDINLGQSKEESA
jgi:hypothetical protein